MEELNNNINELEENEGSENERVCADCGAIIEEGTDFIELDNGDLICESCRDNYFYCEDCERWHHMDEAISILDRHGDFITYVCEDCKSNYYYCEDCGEYFDDDSYGIYTNDGSFHCYSCRDNYLYCEDCGDYYHEDDMIYNEEDDCYYCNNCAEDHCYNDILDYHQFKDWQLYNSDKDKEGAPYIGFELEVCPKDGDTQNQKEAINTLKNNLNVIMAHDGSLDHGGFEIISHPQTYNYIMDHKDLYKKTFDKLIELNYLSHNTSCCGLHFHITRPDNSEVVDRLWLILETYKEQIIKLSRRQPEKLTRWAQFLSDAIVSEDTQKLKSLYFIKKSNKNSTRYYALNNTNTKTIEFRFFRGTLNYNTFMADLQFINNLFTLCNDPKVKIADITWSALTQGEYIQKYILDNNITTDIIPKDYSLEIIKRENTQKLLMTKINRILFLSSKRAIKNINININTKELNNYIDLYNKSIDIKNTYYNLSTIYDELDGLKYKIDTINCKGFLDRVNNMLAYKVINENMTKNDSTLIYKYIDKLKNTINTEVI